MKVGKLSATTVETVENIGAGLNATLMLTSDSDVEISINDNLNYQTYKYGEVIPISEKNLMISKIYYKTLSGTANIRYWLMS